ncbi:MAG: sugar nucleotide-binding protein [Elusimicrobiales bacterium]|nr:sugar nucleotide-binding protein [Elusimicrobiales bacterium]
MKILVIGGSGQLGRALLDVCAKTGIEALGTAHSRWSDGLVKTDISSPQSLQEPFDLLKPDVAVLCSALTAVDYCESHPDEAQKINVEGARNAAAVCRMYGTRLVHISTDYVFDGEGGPYSETAEPNPPNVYGRTKLEAERACAEADARALIIRTSGVCNYDDTSLNFVMQLLGRLSKGERMSVPLDQYYTPTYAPDLAAAIVFLACKGRAGIYNVTGPDYVNRYELAGTICGALGLDESLVSAFKTAERQQKAPRPLKGGLTCKKLEEETGYRTMEVERMLAHIRARLIKSGWRAPAQQPPVKPPATEPTKTAPPVFVEPQLVAASTPVELAPADAASQPVMRPSAAEPVPDEQQPIPACAPLALAEEIAPQFPAESAQPPVPEPQVPANEPVKLAPADIEPPPPLEPPATASEQPLAPMADIAPQIPAETPPPSVCELREPAISEPVSAAADESAQTLAAETKPPVGSEPFFYIPPDIARITTAEPPEEKAETPKTPPGEILLPAEVTPPEPAVPPAAENVRYPPLKYSRSDAKEAAPEINDIPLAEPAEQPVQPPPEPELSITDETVRIALSQAAEQPSGEPVAPAEPPPEPAPPSEPPAPPKTAEEGTRRYPPLRYPLPSYTARYDGKQCNQAKPPHPAKDTTEEK